MVCEDYSNFDYNEAYCGQANLNCFPNFADRTKYIKNIFIFNLYLFLYFIFIYFLFRK